MILQGRDLSIEMHGDDVKLLQNELLQLKFKILDDELQRTFFGPSTRQAVLIFQRQHLPQGLEITGVVDEATAKLINEAVDALHPQPEPQPTSFIVRGHIRQQDERPLAGATVVAVDQDLRGEEILGQTTTNQDGYYEIRYTADKFARAEKGTADLVVRAFAADGSLLVASPIIFNAPPVATADLVIGGGEYRGPSEYELLGRELAPLLEDITIDGIEHPTLIDKIADLKEDEKHQEVTFLSGETGQDSQRIMFLVLAAKLSKETALPPDAFSIAALPVSKITVPPEVFYGLFRQNLPTALPALLAQSPQVLRRALETSLRDNIIPAWVQDDLNKILALFQQLIVISAFKEPEVPGKYSLSALLSTAIPSELQRKFLSHYVQHEGAIEDFWKTLSETPEFGNGQIKKIQQALQLGALTGNHVPLVKELQQNEKLKSLRDLAELDADAWLERIRKVGFPPDIEGNDDEEKAKNYANILTRIVEDAFPTAVIARHIEKEENPDNKDLVMFLAKNPEFEFRLHQVDIYLKSEHANLDGVEDRKKLRNQLKSRARLFKLTPRYQEMQPLLADGLDSAHRITSMGKSVFMMNYGEKVGGTAITEEIYAKANHTSAMALTLLTTYGAAFNATEPRVTEVHTALKEAFEHNPSWEDLFGSTSYCDCEHCSSVLSPAAYLVDILQELKKLPSQIPNKTAKDMLFDRRPDLGEIELSCENTNTLLPYVDLVNEVLENAVSPQTPFAIDLTLEGDLDNRTLSQSLLDAFANNGITLSHNAVISVITKASQTAKGTQWLITDNAREYKVSKDSSGLDVSLNIQTRGTAEELSANPEHVIPEAYDILRDAVYPWNLPLNLWVEEARTYIEHLGVHRHDLMKTFYKGTPSDALMDMTIANEYLALTSKEAQIITGAAVEPSWKFWGLEETNNDITDPADGSTHIIGNWEEVLKHASIFLQQTGSLQQTDRAYKELLELLGTNFINPIKADGTPNLAISNPATCDLGKLEITGLDAAILGKIHRFVRLQRKLGWTIRDLDKAITALQPKDANVLSLTENFLIQLSHIERLRAELKVPLVQMLSWWAPLDTARYHTEEENGAKSLYEQLFLNRAVMNPVDEIFTLYEPTRAELADTNGTLNGHTSTLLAALRISAANLSLLTATEVTDDKLNLANLSRLYRIASLSKTLKLRINEFLSLKVLTGINLTDGAQPEDTLRFVETVQKIRASGFSIAELDYLLRHQLVTTSAVAPTEESIALTLDQIRSSLKKIAAENTFTPDTTDPTGDLTKQKLAVLLPAEQVESAIALLSGSSVLSDADKKAFIETHFAQFLDIADAKVKLIGPAPDLIMEKEKRFAYVLGPLLNYLRRTLSESLVKQTFSEALKLESAVVELLLFKLVKSVNDPPKMSTFLDPAFVESQVPLTSVAFKSQFQTFVLLEKIATIIARLEIRPEELGWILAHGAGLGWMDLSALPVEEIAAPPALFGGWERLVDLFSLLDRLPSLRGRLSSEEWKELLLPFGMSPDTALPTEPALLVVFDLAAKFNPGDAVQAETQLLQILSERSQWKPEDTEFLLGAGAFGLIFPKDYKDEQALVRLKSCFDLIKRLGVSAARVLEWTEPDVTSEVARSVKQTTKAKYEDAEWLKVAKPLSDVLREKQRAALVAYLVQKMQFQDANGLFAHYLIDVEMNPCMMTSRIKQAIGSVQLFIQRALMNLEANVIPPGEGTTWRAHWKWMKNYRVWEANRKVFLYPENWIEPELRDDKTPFFKDLENQLLQNEVTKDTAEVAFLNYLEKLDAVARLEIVGMYHQEAEDEQDKDILHVCGRTMGIPHIYYYRQGVKIKKDPTHDYWTWTAWEKVDIDIEGDHLIPVVWNRRLHLFWPIFTEKAIPPKQEEKNQESDPRRYLEIKLAWSEYRNMKWSAKQISKEFFVSKEEPAGSKDTGLNPRDRHFFRAIINPDGKLILRIFMQWFDQPGMPIGEFSLSGCLGSVRVFYQHWYVESRGLDELKKIVSPMQVREEGAYYEISKPPDTLVDGMTYEEKEEITQQVDHPLTLETEKTDIEVLLSTPGTFRLLYPHQDEQFLSQRPFFYQDDTKTFFVVPEDVEVPIKNNWYNPFKVSPAWIDRIHKYYYIPSILIHDRIGPVINPTRSISDRSSTSILTAPGTISAPGVTTALSKMPGAGMITMPSNPIGRPTAFVMHGSIPSDIYIDQKYRPGMRYLFETFYHPYVCRFIQQLNQYGIDGLLQRSLQFLSIDFFEVYNPHVKPVEVVELPYPREDVDFSCKGSYTQYNWELFFHVPLLIADRLSKNQRFEEAQNWFHYIFDPTDASSNVPAEHFWKVRPFIENMDVKKRMDELLILLDSSSQSKEKDDMINQVEQWRDNPFKPHLIARLRLTAYQKNIVMKYIDNLISWGDQLFRRETIESLNEATLLYILASEILGPPPQNLPAQKTKRVWTYNELEKVPLDDFSNALVEIESHLPAAGSPPLPGQNNQPSLAFYFCIPKNDKLLGYWKTVADRLSQIRHCKNIEGLFRQLLPFEPSIDPALLVRAFAAGEDISSVLNDLNAALPHYRFNVMLQKATELCNDVKTLGAVLLSALEKKDAEELALLRSDHELKLLDAVKEIKIQQIKEAQNTLEGLQKQKEVVAQRHKYYKEIQFLNAGEAVHLELMGLSLTLQSVQTMMDMIASGLSYIPDFKLGVPTTVGSTFGGANLSNAMRAFSAFMGGQASIMSATGSMCATVGGHQRRWDDWKLQERLAAKEMEQIDKQIAAGEIRKAIAEKDLQNHDLQVENAKEVDEYMRDKFTNRELYDWMVGQISGIYFQSYQLAYDIAKRAERSYRFELGLVDSNFIQFGYWDSLKKGLLAGEKLHYDLKRMEVSYLDQNKREYEITKNISVVLHDPLALIALKETGHCEVFLPEELFDADYPGHYMRRIKNVSLTIPCVTGPYTSINCTLTLLSNKTRIDGDAQRDYPEQEDDDRFVTNFAALQSIATSHAQNDSGMFELNFRDERYLPFEGAGIISRWRIDMPKDCNAFDFNTVSDVIIRLNYTAREGGDLLREKARSAVIMPPQENLVRMFSARHEFPNEWYRFLQPTDPEAPNHTLQIDLKQERFPFWFRGRKIIIDDVTLFLKLKDNFNYDDSKQLALIVGSDPHKNFQIAGSPIKQLPFFKPQTGSSVIPSNVPTLWTLKVQENDLNSLGTASDTSWWQTVKINGVDHARLKPDAIEDIWIVCQYSAT